MPKRKIIAAYVPVIHRGYLDFFSVFPEVQEIHVFDHNILKKIDYLRKDLRALTPVQQVKLLKSLGRFKLVRLLKLADINKLDIPGIEVVFPDEDISREVAKDFKKAKINFHPVFLRWDRRNLENTSLVDPKEKRTSSRSHKQLMAEAYQESTKSSDIWRRVGAILLDNRGQKIGTAHNQAEPTAASTWMEGDPRNIFKQAVNTDLAVFIHAEAALIAESAKRGIKLQDAALYATTFPCPWCAKLIAYSGIARIYYAEGYGSLDAKRLLVSHKVKLYKVDYAPPPDLENPAVWVPYKRN